MNKYQARMDAAFKKMEDIRKRADAESRALTAEEIALQVLEGNALVRAYTAAIGAINEEYKRMMQPDDDKKPEPIKGSMY